MQNVEFRVGDHAVRAELHMPGGALGKRPRSAIVMLHGLNSCIAEFGDLPAKLAAAGHAVLAFDQRGFGASEGEVGLTSPEQAIAEAEAAAACVRTHAPEAPLGLFGHSLGGAYAIQALARGGPWRFAILAHPVDRLWDEIAPLQRGLYHLLGRRAVRRRAKGKASGYVPYTVHYKEIFVSKEAAKAAERPAFLLKKANLANYRMALTMRASDAAPRVHVPSLVVWSALDKAVQPVHTMALASRLAGPVSFLEHKGGHSAFRDLDGDKVASGIVRWLDATVPALGA